MATSDVLLQPVALALFTRDEENDYRWVFEEGREQVLDELKTIHRHLIADQDARPAATFALLVKGERLGLLAANLKTTRYDHLRTRFDDTLLLAFDSGERVRLLKLAAALLGSESEHVRQRLLDYAEERYREKQPTDRTLPKSLEFPSFLGMQESDQQPTEHGMGGHVGLRSNETNRKRVARILEGMASNARPLLHSFLLVSTGFVDKPKLQQHAKCYSQFIALTRSSTFPDDEEVSLQNIGAEKQSKAGRWPRRPLLFMFISGLLATLLLGSWLLLTNISSQPPDLRTM